eukprot:5218-Heterococcus_DN1.PRE.3
MTEAPKAAPVVAKVKPVHWHKLPFGKYLMYELNRPGFRIIFFPFCIPAVSGANLPAASFCHAHLRCSLKIICCSLTLLQRRVRRHSTAAEGIC